MVCVHFSESHQQSAPFQKKKIEVPFPHITVINFMNNFLLITQNTKLNGNNKLDN